ncbi:MAG TPA: CDP-glycerol glycerophosphotransferase family protein [Panacibacter sp.]|nr:CDP-glycerol glycerophosphotransferase family protein [Panacibacter sp.]
MLKQRLLVTISFSFSIRYLYRTGLLKQLQDFSEIVIAITWNEKELIEELENDGFEVHLVPEPVMQPAYNSIRKKIEYWFNAFQLQSPTRKIQIHYLNQYLSAKTVILRKTREWYNYLKFLLPGYSKRLFAREKQLLKTKTNFDVYVQWINDLNIDSVFTVTPFHKQEDLLLRACKSAGKKMITSILSFDNITKRSWIPVEYDCYMVWNKYNESELKRIYPFTINRPVTITGAPQFDFYFKKDYLLSLNEWKNIVGLPFSDRKIILYAGGPQLLFPNEPQYLQHLDQAINDGLIKNNPVILFRCHPIDKIERWKKALNNSTNIIFDHSWTGTENIFNANIINSDIKKLCSTLAYTDVHINLCSTMTVDGSTFKKPQIGPAYDAVNPDKEYLLQQMYHQEHFLPIIKTGGLLLATSKELLIKYVNDALENPVVYITKSNRIIEEIITYTEGQSTSRVTKAIKDFLTNN